MKKTVFSILMVLALLLTACSGSESSEADAPEAPADSVENAGTETDAQPDGGEADPVGVFETPSEENPCIPFSILGLKLVAPYPNLPPVTADDWSVGPDDAAVTFMEYSEPQCPYCSQFEPLLMAIYEKYPNDVRVVYRHRPFPESFHDKSLLSSQALEAAGKQGLFQELKNFLFERQHKNPEDPEQAVIADSEFWAGVAPNDFDEWLAARVHELGIEVDQFLVDMFSDEIVTKIKQTQTDADALEILGTPTLFINGYQWPENQRGLEIFSTYVELLKNNVVEYETCPEMVIDVEKTYTAIISTTKGDIVVELYPDAAPNAVNSFVFLAREGWYDDAPFIIDEEYALSGDPSGTGYGGPGYIYLDEFSDDLTLDEPGMLAVLGLGLTNLNGSAFFINKKAMDNQQGRTIFGRVLEGMDVVTALEARESYLDDPVDRVVSIIIAEE